MQQQDSLKGTYMERNREEILFYLRQETGFTLRQLCEGICSVSQMGKIEQNQLAADYFLIDRLYTRLGKPVDRLEYVLPLEVYEIYEQRFLIQRDICHGELDAAEIKLKEFEQSRPADKSLHRQFILSQMAQIAWIRGEAPELVLKDLDSAIQETMPLERAVESEMALSAEELRLLLFRWEVSQQTSCKRPAEEVRTILSYRNLTHMDTAEKVKFQPYAALLLGMQCDLKKDGSMLETLTKEALSLLREEGRLLYMPEILEQYVNVLEYRNADCEFIRTLRSEHRSLLKIEEMFNIHLEKFRLFEHRIRRFEIDSEIIRKERKAAQMSQEELSDGICATRTLAGIESGSRSPREQTMNDLLEKMNRKRTKINSIITTDDYEILWLKREFNGMLYYSEYEKAEEILKQLEERLDISNPKNRQFLKGEKVTIMYRLKKWTPEQCLQELEEQLSLTLDMKQDIFRHSLTVTEHSLLNEMAVIYYENQQKEKASQIWEKQVQSFEGSRVHPVFHIMEWEGAMENLATSIRKENQTQTSIELCLEKLTISMEAGRGNSLGRSLITLACATEQQNDNRCVDAFLYGIDILRLYKMEKRAENALSYILRKDFYFSEKLNESLQLNFQHLCKEERE